MNIENDNNIREFKLHSSMNKIQFLLLMFFMIIVLLCGFYDVSENNKKVSIECYKINNKCIFKENKYLFGTNQTYLPFDLMQNAYVKYLGTIKAIDKYSLIFPTMYGHFNLYFEVSGKTRLEKIAEEFNIDKNNTNLQQFSIYPTNKFQMTDTAILAPILLFLLIYLIFFKGIEEIITVNKNTDEIKIMLKRIIWAKSRIIQITEIQQLNLVKVPYDSGFTIKYLDLNNKRYSFLLSYYKSEKIYPIYNQLNEFIFGEKENNR